MTFGFKQILIILFSVYCLGEFGRLVIRNGAPQPEIFLWIVLAIGPVIAFAVRYGRPPEAPASGDEGFWWRLCGITAMLWALLKFFVTG
ncbi:MAG: hypothetical protein ACXWT3_06645 [Methylococcaceae bacterium]